MAKQAPVSTDKHLAKANNLLAELDREEKDGFNLRESRDDEFDMDMSAGKKKDESKKKGGLGAMNLKASTPAEDDEAYDEDFEYDIEEESQEPAVDNAAFDADLNARSG